MTRLICAQVVGTCIAGAHFACRIEQLTHSWSPQNLHWNVREPTEHVGRVAAPVVQANHLHPDRVPARSVFRLQLRLDLGDDLRSGLIPALFGRRVRRREY